MTLDEVVASLFPAWGAKRAHARALVRLYEAAQSSQYHRPVRGAGLSGDAVMEATGSKLRDRARNFDENSDLAVGILDTLSNNIIGTGIRVEPMARTSRGMLHERVNNELRELWRDFWRRPETTGELPGPEVERLLCRSWLRDGEVFARHHDGALPGGAEHLHEVPYSIELIEADLLPFDKFVNTSGGTIHGVEKDQLGRPVAYHFLTDHPGNTNIGIIPSLDTAVIPAQFITHLKFVRRIRQTRGVTILHAAIQRLSDIHEYETSERIAARVASDFTGYIKRSADMTFPIDSAATNREIMMQAGMIWDNLLPGEEIATIGHERPNTGLLDFRNSQLRAATSGTSTNYSTVSKDYNGTYSAQRQEMIESRPAYERLTNYFVDVMMLPIWQRFVVTARAAGLIRIPSNIMEASLMAPQLRGPGMPWIDPLKEVQSDIAAIEAGLKSRVQVIRERGGDPAQVDAEREQDTMAPEPAATPPPNEQQDTEESNAA